MKEIMIIADGIVAKQFLERVCSDISSDNNYTVIFYNDKTITDKKAEHIKYYKLDPTSFSKLKSVYKESIVEIFIVTGRKFDAIESYKNIRKLNKEIHIIMLDNWHLQIEDPHLSLLGTRDILSSRLFDFLPNVSVVAQNVGLGIGEIMEIDVPFGSSYVYRHVSSIKQKKWKIAAIYRANKLILPTYTTMILPNDILLVIGDPNILRGINISIKQEFGSFPSPYGKNIFVLLDMKNDTENEIKNLTNIALLLHSILNNNKLVIKIINPTLSKTFYKIKSYNKGSTKVIIDYEESDYKNSLTKEIDNSNIGLIVTNNINFKKYKSIFYKSKTPIFKTGEYDFSKINRGVVLPEGNLNIEKITAIILDISVQFGIDIELYDYDPEEMKKNKELIEHFKNLATIFNRNIKVINPKRNPIMELEYVDDIVQFIPFTKEIKSTGIFSLFSKSFQKLFYKLKKSHQLFIPTDEQ